MIPYHTDSLTKPFLILILLYTLSMAMSVIRTKRGLVKPAKETPMTTLDLSVIDSLPVLRCNVKTLHVFRHGPGAARVIREALSLALVPYYPLAGRLSTESNSNKPGCPQIECSGDGVWYVEASADCTLDSLNFFDDVESFPWDHLLLLPDDIPEIQRIDPLVQMQVYTISNYKLTSCLLRLFEIT